MPIFIQSKDNAKLKQLKGLIEQASFRKKLQCTILEGAHLVESYLESTQQPVSVFTTETGLQHPENANVLAQLNCPIYVVAETLYKQFSLLAQATPLLAIIPTPELSKNWQGTQDSLILDQIQDPGNVGTLLRSAAAVGIKQILCTTGTASIWSPRVLRAAMGAHFSLSIFEHVDYQEIISRFQIPLYATSSHRPTSIYGLNLQSPCAWILGNEGQGVHPLLLSTAQAVTIPQPGGQESLNVAIAGSVCLFEMSRQRL